MKLECPHKWETTLWHRATTVALLGYAVPKADALEDFAKFLTPLPAGSEFQPFLLRLHACAEQSRGGSMPSRMTLELTARLVHTGVMLVQWSCVKHPEPGNNHHLWTPVREIRDNRLVWGIEWKWTPRVMVSRTPNQSVTIAKRDVAEILRDLCFWQSLATSMSLAELTQKITPYLHGILLWWQRFRMGSHEAFSWLQIGDGELKNRCIDYWGPSCPFIFGLWASFHYHGSLASYGSTHAGTEHSAPINQEAQVAYIKDAWKNRSPQIIWSIWCRLLRGVPGC